MQGVSKYRFQAGRLLLVLLMSFALAGVAAGTAFAAPGVLDPSFSGDGKQVTSTNTSISDSGENAGGVVVDPDGKIVVAGNAKNPDNGTNDISVVRYKQDGSLDPTFSGDGIVMTDTAITGNARDEWVHDVAVLPNGKIVVASQVTHLDTSSSLVGLTRYNKDGSLDTSFGGVGFNFYNFAGSASPPVQAEYDLSIAIQEDTKKIVLVTDVNRLGSGTDVVMARVKPDSGLDTTFGDGGNNYFPFTTFGGASTDIPTDMVLGSDGGPIVVGHTNPGTTFSTWDVFVARYTSNGLPNTGFGNGGKLTSDLSSGSADLATAVDYQPDDGKIVVAAGLNVSGGLSPSSAYGKFAAVRYEQNGMRDGDFGANGVKTVDFSGKELPTDVAVQSDNKIVLFGHTIYDLDKAWALARLQPEGSLDSSFSYDGRTVSNLSQGSDEASGGIALQEDGKTVAAGTRDRAYFPDFAVNRYFGADDYTPPAVRPPVVAFQGAATTTNGTNSTQGDTPVKVTWSATDREGEVTRYQLQRSHRLTSDDYWSSYKELPLAKPTDTTASHQLGSGYMGRYRVRASDDNGNVSGWKYMPAFTIDRITESGAMTASGQGLHTLTRTGTWEDISASYYEDGKIKQGWIAGATAKLKFTGKSVAFISAKSIYGGKGEVWLDGRKVTTLDFYAASTLPRQVVFSRDNLDPTTKHTLEIKVLGTKRAAAQGTSVYIDSFKVMR